MRNIYIVEDEKNKREYFIGKKDNKYFYLNHQMKTGGVLKACHVYITSNEDILDGDAFIENGKYVCPGSYNIKPVPHRTNKKIIMSDDPQLINDGVQELSYEFIKWLAENPNVEIIGIDSELKYFDKNGFCVSGICFDTDYEKTVYYITTNHKPVYVKCYDRHNQELFAGDYVDVQRDGVHLIYKREDGQLYFKPYGEEDRVSAYFCNDISKCDIEGNWLTPENEQHTELANTVVADIRNKMGYVSNLLSLLRLKEGTPDEHEEYLDERISELITKSEESIEFLRNLDTNNYIK